MPGSCDVARTVELAIEASPNGVLVVDPEGTIVLTNRKIEWQFGYAQDEMVGQVVDMLLPESQHAAHAAQRAGFVEGPESRPMGAACELLGRRKDGTCFPIEIGLNPLRTAAGLFVLASVVDITERRRLVEAQGATRGEPFEFERLVVALSGQFINLPAEQIADAMRNGLRRICEQLGLDRSTLQRVGPDGALVDPVSSAIAGVPLLDPPAERQLLPWTLEQVRAGQVVQFSSINEIPLEVDRNGYSAAGIKSGVVVPLYAEGRVDGVVTFSAVRDERTWSGEIVHRLTVIASIFGEVLAQQRRDEAVRSAAAEAQRLRDKLQVEHVSLKREVHELSGQTRIVGRSATIRQVLEQIEQVAGTDSTVLLLGETGTGKELFATHIHELGARRSRAMVRVNCAAIPATLIESELFGREKGAYTGALARQMGRFELADHSTIFLDEIGDLPPDVQVKLLRVIEERQVERLGSPRSIPVDTRIVAATHRNLEQRIENGTFREDLYYRLNVFPIHVPPLRERSEDIPLLVWRFVEEFSRAFGRRVETIGKDNMVALQRYSWPGNIRELRNVVERAMIVATHARLVIPVPQTSAAAVRRSSKLVDVEKEHIRAVLDSTAWRVRGAGGAAERLGLKPTTLETRMAKLGITRASQA